MIKKQIHFYKDLMQEKSKFSCIQPSIWFQEESQVQNDQVEQKQDSAPAEELNSKKNAEINHEQHERVCENLLEIQKTKLLQTFALYAIILEVYPTIVEQSIQYLFKLSRTWSKDKKIFEKFTLKSIKNYVFSFICNGFDKFYELSMKILINRIQQIIKQQQQAMNEDSLNIRIEFFAHYIKNIVEFQEYLPKKKKTEYLKPHCLIRALNIPKECYSSLKRFYTESKREQIQFFDDQTLNIQMLINTYYILQLRNKCEVLGQDFKELAFCINQTPQAFLKEKINYLKDCKKQSIDQQKSCKIRQTSKTFSDAFFLLNNKQKVKLSTLSLEEIEQQAAIFQYLLKSNPRQIKNHEKIRYLTEKYKKTMNNYCVKYRNYTLKMKQYADLNIDTLKDKYISNRLQQNFNITYQKICKGAYQSSFIYVSRKYFDENIDRLLRKQCRYQQMCYLQQLISLMLSQNDKKEFIFLQKYQFFGQSDKYQSDKAIFFAAISDKGVNYSKVINNSPNSQRTFLNQLMKNVGKSSIILSNDPSLQLEGHFNGKIQKNVYVLPCFKASKFPNPCQFIYQMILQSLKILRKKRNQAKVSTKLMVQALSNKIINDVGLDIVALEINLSAMSFVKLQQKDQISDERKSKHKKLLQMQLIEATDNQLSLNTQGLRKKLHSLQLYRLRILSIQAKQIKK